VSEPRVPSSNLVARSDGLLAIAFAGTIVDEQTGTYTLIAATCKDPCTAWTTHRIAALAGDPQNYLPAMGFDDDGTLYASWTEHTSDGHFPLRYAYSTDSGTTWSTPITVATPFPQGAAALPWIVGGSAGRIGVACLVTPSSAFAPNAPWYVAYSATPDASSPTPSFSSSLVSTQLVDENAGYPDRIYLGDFVTVDAMPNGSAIVAYAQHQPTDTVTTAYAAIQSGGPVLR
jgi:hypothetical protein